MSKKSAIRIVLDSLAAANYTRLSATQAVTTIVHEGVTYVVKVSVKETYTGARACGCPRTSAALTQCWRCYFRDNEATIAAAEEAAKFPPLMGSDTQIPCARVIRFIADESFNTTSAWEIVRRGGVYLRKL